MNIKSTSLNSLAGDLAAKIKVVVTAAPIAMALLIFFALPVAAEDIAPGQIADRAALAEYQATLAHSSNGHTDRALWVQVTAAPGTMPFLADTADLAFYQAQAVGSLIGLGETSVNITIRKSKTDFEQITDRTQLAEFQAQLVEGTLPVVGSLSAVSAMNEPVRFGQIENLARLADYHSLSHGFASVQRNVMVHIQVANENDTNFHLETLADLAAYQANMAVETEQMGGISDVVVMTDYQTFEALSQQ